jgi:hypothetical protein
MILDSTKKSLEILLDGAVATNQLPITVSWVDVSDTAFTPASYHTISNSANVVKIAYSPGTAGTRRVIKTLFIFNADTASRTVTLRLNDNATTRIIVRKALAADETLQYTDSKGFEVF